MRYTNVLVIILVFQQTVTGGPCDGSGKELFSSERKSLTLDFNAIKEKQEQLQCYWKILGIPSQPLVLTLKHLTIGYCSQTTFIIYDGLTEDPTKSVYDVCENVTSSRTIQTDTGNAMIKLVSEVGSFPFTFEISYISSVQVFQPFDTGDRGNIGVILAIVLGIVSFGLLVIVVTWFLVKRHHKKYGKRDTIPLELKSIENLPEVRMFERTVTDELMTSSRMIHVASTNNVLQNNS